MRYFLDDGHPDDGWVPAMDHVGGPPVSQYHPRLGAIILSRLDRGETVREVCADTQMPCPATLKRWRKVHPDFVARYDQVMDERAHHRRLHARLKRERWREWIAIEVKIGRRGKPAAAGGGRRSTYDAAWAAAFCRRAAKAEPVCRICEDPAMPSRSQVYGWLRRQPEFVAMYMEAKREAVSWLAFQAEMAADRVLDGVPSRAAFSAIKREVARIEGRIGLVAPKIYR